MQPRAGLTGYETNLSRRGIMLEAEAEKLIVTDVKLSVSRRRSKS
jgi:hypothetical protein